MPLRTCGVSKHISEKWRRRYAETDWRGRIGPAFVITKLTWIILAIVEDASRESRLNRTGKTAWHWPSSEGVSPSQPLREEPETSPAIGIELVWRRFAPCSRCRHTGPGGKPCQRGRARRLQGPFRPRRRAYSRRPDRHVHPRAASALRQDTARRAAARGPGGRRARDDRGGARRGNRSGVLGVRHNALRPRYWRLCTELLVAYFHEAQSQRRSRLHFVLSAWPVVPLAAMLGNARTDPWRPRRATRSVADANTAGDRLGNLRRSNF